MEDSIYSLGFLSQLVDTIIDPKFNVITGHLIEDEVSSSELDTGSSSSGSVASTIKASKADSDEGEGEGEAENKGEDEPEDSKKSSEVA